MLITRILQKQRHGSAKVQVVQLIQQGTDTFGCEVGIIGYGDQLLCNCVDRAKPIEALSTGGRLDQDAGQ